MVVGRKDEGAREEYHEKGPSWPARPCDRRIEDPRVEVWVPD